MGSKMADTKVNLFCDNNFSWQNNYMCFEDILGHALFLVIIYSLLYIGLTFNNYFEVDILINVYLWMGCHLFIIGLNMNNVDFITFCAVVKVKQD